MDSTELDMVDIGKAEKEIVTFLQEELEEAGAEGYVVGVSGGIDSAVTVTLAVEAVGPDNVAALVMPGEPSTEENIKDAKDLCRRLQTGFYDLDIEPLVQQFAETVPFTPDRIATGNLRVRTRMVLNYLVANQENLLALGTGNRTETLLGYFTKYGDGAADVKPLGDLYKTEVRALAEHLNLDRTFLEKPPTAGMWEGQTDEDELGVPYREADRILQLALDAGVDLEDVASDPEIEPEDVERVMELHIESDHKRAEIPTPGLR